MRKRIMLTAAVAAALVGTVTAGPAAADTTAASWSCSPNWDNEAGSLTMACSYDGTARGAVGFWRNGEPEDLGALDGAQDHRAVIAELTWTQDGQSKRSTVRNAGKPGTIKQVSVPEGTKVSLRLCLEGHSCTSKYNAIA